MVERVGGICLAIGAVLFVVAMVNLARGGSQCGGNNPGTGTRFSEGAEWVHIARAEPPAQKTPSQALQDVQSRIHTLEYLNEGRGRYGGGLAYRQREDELTVLRLKENRLIQQVAGESSDV